MRFQIVEYTILPDGNIAYGVLQQPDSQLQTNQVIGLGMGLLFMLMVAELGRSLISDSAEQKKERLPRLPQTSGKNEKSELEELVIAIRDAPSEEDRIWIKLTAPTRLMEQYRKLSFKQVREIELQYPKKTTPVNYHSQTDTGSVTIKSTGDIKDSDKPQTGTSESWLSRLLKSGVAMAVPLAWRWLLADNRSLIELDLLPTTEASESKVEGILKQLKAGVESIQQSEQFRLFLSTMGKFHDYSIGNMILIMLQRPQATHVAGFHTWKELGRWVKAGEKGIAILAPVFPPAATCETCGSKLPRSAKFCPKCGTESNTGEETAAAPRFFRAVYVFDLDQTEGKPLPEFDVPALTGEANDELFDLILNLSKDQGLTVSFESKPDSDPEIKGFYSGKLIWVRPEESRAQQLKTLLHEMAHYYTEGVLGIPRKDAETIAESAAFAVGAHFGFDSGARSFPYVALWAQDKKVLEQNLAVIKKVTSKIIEDLDQHAVKTGGATKTW